jgi:hypothetical protein
MKWGSYGTECMAQSSSGSMTLAGDGWILGTRFSQTLMLIDDVDSNESVTSEKMNTRLKLV